MVTQRKGEMLVMESKGDMQHLEFEIPSRGLIGLRSNMLTNTAGEAVMAHRFLEYKPRKGPIPGRNNGVLLSKNQEKPPLTPSTSCRSAVPSSSIRAKTSTQVRSSPSTSSRAT
ncbi:hypothetical protein ACQ86N_43815 [Puia sp. P3]|uniref:hypothetical protein n=1 Tax=Puia sp. P3 TaxID=3423952 RepID=UPI003D678666